MVPQEVDDLDAWYRWYNKLWQSVDPGGPPLYVADMELAAYLDGREQAGVEFEHREVALSDGRRRGRVRLR